MDPRPLTDGLWGVPTSTVDWCESNYAHTALVAEFWNAASSVAMVLFGLLGVLLHRGVLRGRFVFAFVLLVLVGLGSVAFHGTLRFEAQMLDELPMVYLVVWIVYILVENGAQRRFGFWFPAALVVYAVGVTVVSVSSRGAVQFAIFHTTFGALELFSLASVYLLHRRSRDASGRRVFRRGMAAYAVAITVWFIDLRFCAFVAETLPEYGAVNPQLHAWWHVLVSYGFYALLLVIALNQVRPGERALRVVFRGAVLPVLLPGDGALGSNDAPRK